MDAQANEIPEPAVRGAGIDMVHVPSFAADLERPGSTFVRAAFTAGERAAATRRKLSGEALARHLAGRWAVKEAVIKAWSQALYGRPPRIPRDEVDWREIEVVADAWGRIAVVLHGRILEATAMDAITPESLHISISHDGDHAIALAILAG